MEPRTRPSQRHSQRAGPNLPRREIDVEDEDLLFQGLCLGLPTAPRAFRRGTLSYLPTAAHLPLDQWLPPSQLALFVDPEPSGVSPEMSAPRFFNAPMAQWREALRCMTRAESRGRATPALFWSLSRADKHGSRSPDRWQEAVEFPGEDDRVFHLPPASYLRIHSRDLKDMYVSPVSASNWAEGTFDLVRRIAFRRVRSLGPKRESPWHFRSTRWS